MRRKKDGILVGQRGIIHGNLCKRALTMCCQAIHIDILIWTCSCIVKASKKSSLMQQDRYSIDIEYCPCDVRPSAKCSYLEGVQTLVLVELDLQKFIVEVSLRSHRYQYYGRTTFSPWNEICVVLIDREEYHGLVGVHSVVVSNMLKIMLMNCGLGVFLIGS